MITDYPTPTLGNKHNNKWNSKVYFGGLHTVYMLQFLTSPRQTSMVAGVFKKTDQVLF